jgi:Tfp pilus assembly protein PilF
MNRSLGFSQLGLGQTTQGQLSLEKAFAANPSDTRTGMALAMLHMRQGKSDKAMKIAETMVKRDPANLTTLNFLVSLKGASGDKAGARAAYAQVRQDSNLSVLNLALRVGEKA